LATLFLARLLNYFLVFNQPTISLYTNVHVDKTGAVSLYYSTLEKRQFSSHSLWAH